MAKTAGIVALSALATLALVAAAAASQAAKLRLLPDDASRGRPDAPVTIVEFTDYQCPFCKRFEAETWPQLKRNYVDTGKVRFIVRDLPLEFHDSALPAAEAAHCAGEQGKFWPMHDALIAKGSDLSAGGLQTQAGRLALDLPRFQACVAQHRYAKDILRNAALANSLGLEGTPAFVIGRVHDGELSGVSGMGAQPYENFAQQIEEELAAAKAGT
jgi:protein-disulfide isomerase